MKEICLHLTIFLFSLCIVILCSLYCHEHFVDFLYEGMLIHFSIDGILFVATIHFLYSILTGSYKRKVSFLKNVMVHPQFESLMVGFLFVIVLKSSHTLPF